jgi:hypothetical protein
MMLERVYMAPSMYEEAGFMSCAHTDEDIEKTIVFADEVLSLSCNLSYRVLFTSRVFFASFVYSFSILCIVVSCS